MKIITWADYPDFKQTARLSGRTFTLRGRWNTSREYWTLDIFDADGLPLLYGQKLVLNSEIIERYNDERLPDGKIFIIDTSSIDQFLDNGVVISRIGRNDIGASVFLAYEPNV